MKPCIEKPFFVCILLYLAITAILFGFPAWKFFHYGQLPDFLIFLESFKNGAAGEGLANRLHYLQQVTKMGIEPLPGKTASMFGMHFQPFLYLLLPLFKLAPSPYVLFLLQASLVASAVFPLYRLFQARLESQAMALCGTLCFVLHPIFLGSATAFFPSFLSIALLVWAFYFLESCRYAPYMLCLLLTLMLKELMAIPVFLAGIHCFFTRSRTLGSLICIISAAYLVLCTELIIPYFAVAGQNYHFADSYGETEGSVYTSILVMLASPEKLVAAIFRPQVLIYLGNILVPLLFLPVFSYEFLLTIPLFLQNIFAVGVWYSLFTTGHLSAPLFPFLLLAFSRTAARLQSRLSHTSMVSLLFVAVLLNLVFSMSILKDAKLADPEMKEAAKILHSHAKKGETIATNANDSTIASHFILTNPIEQYPDGDTAPWNVVVYNQALCGGSIPPGWAQKQVKTAKEQSVLPVARSVCRALQDPCTVLHFDKSYYPNKSFTKMEGIDIRLVVFENICQTRKEPAANPL